MNISKILSYVVLAIGAIGAVLLLLMSNGFDTLMGSVDITDAKDLVKDTSSSLFADATSLVSPMYGLTLLILIIIIAVTLVSVVSALIKNPSGLKKALIGIAAFAVVLVIAFIIAEGKETTLRDGDILSEGTSRLVGMGLYAFYFFALVAVGLMFFSGLKKLISK